MRKLLEITEALHVLNLVNPLFYIVMAVGLSIDLIICIFYTWTTKPFMKWRKDYLFLRSDKCDTKWCRDMYKSLYGPMYVNDKGKFYPSRFDRHNQLLQTVLKRRYKLIKNAGKR